MAEVDAERARNLAGSLPEHVVEMRDETHVSVPKGALENLARWALELDARVRQLEKSLTMAYEIQEELRCMHGVAHGLHSEAIARAERAEAEVGHLRAALEHIRHACRIGASPEWACRAARGEAEATLGERGAREERGRLSDKAREARRPLPPENLVGALQDTVHEDTGRTRAVHVGTREEPSDGES